MSTKRVILTNDSRLLREMLQHVINKAEGLEIVSEIPEQNDLSSAIERLEPEWVVVSTQQNDYLQTWLHSCISQHPSVRFIVLSSNNRSVKLRSQAPRDEDLTNLSLHDFIQVLERDFQPT